MVQYFSQILTGLKVSFTRKGNHSGVHHEEEEMHKGTSNTKEKHKQWLQFLVFNTLFLVHTTKMFFVYYDCYLLCCKLKDRQQHKRITFIATQVTAESSNMQTWAYRALHLQDYKHSTMSLVVFLEHSLACTQGKETRPHVHTNILRLLNYAGTKVEHIQTLWAATMWLGLTSTNQVRRNSGVTVTSA